MANHSANRSVLGFVNFIAWCVVVIGVILSIYGMTNSPRGGFGSSSTIALTYAIPGMVIALLGLVGVALSAVGYATVDTAETNEQILSVMREFVARQRVQASGGPAPQPKLGAKWRSELSPQGVSKPSDKAVTIAEPAKPAPPPPPPKPKAIEHLGKRIEPSENGWRVGDVRFESVDKAKAHIETTTLRAER